MIKKKIEDVIPQGKLCTDHAFFIKEELSDTASFTYRLEYSCPFLKESVCLYKHEVMRDSYKICQINDDDDTLIEL